MSDWHFALCLVVLGAVICSGAWIRGRRRVEQTRPRRLPALIEPDVIVRLNALGEALGQIVNDISAHQVTHDCVQVTAEQREYPDPLNVAYRVTREAQDEIAALIDDLGGGPFGWGGIMRKAPAPPDLPA